LAEPPAPIAALGDVNLLPGLTDPIGIAVLGAGPLAKVLPGLVQRIPSRVVFLVTNPDGKVVIDPASRKQFGQGVAWRKALQISSHAVWQNVRRAHAALIEGAKKDRSAIGIMFPAILAVENDADQGRFGGIDGLADAA